jgi:hypothetical protein
MALPMGGEVGDIGGLAGRCGWQVDGLPADAGPLAARRIETKTLQPVIAQLALRFRHHGVGAVAVDLSVGDPGAFNATGLEVDFDRQIAPRRVVSDTAVTVADLGRGTHRATDLGGGAARVIVGQATQGTRRIAGDVAGSSDCRVVGGDRRAGRIGRTQRAILGLADRIVGAGRAGAQADIGRTGQVGLAVIRRFRWRRGVFRDGARGTGGVYCAANDWVGRLAGGGALFKRSGDGGALRRDEGEQRDPDDQAAHGDHLSSDAFQEEFGGWTKDRRRALHVFQRVIQADVTS